MTTGKRMKKPGAGDAGTPEKEGATPAAKAGGAKKEAKPSKKSTAAAPKAKEKAAPKAKAPSKKAASDDEDLDAPIGIEDEDFEDKELDDLDDLDDLESEPDEDEAPPKKAAAAGGKAKAATPSRKTAALADEDDDLGDEDEDFEDEDEDEEGDEEGAKAKAKSAKPAAPAGKPAAAKRPGEEGEAAPSVVPARRLTPEAKAKLNELLAKGVSLNDALRQAAQWETFVAPVREAMPTMDRMRPAHRPKSEPEREHTIDDLDAPPEEEAEEGIE